MFMASLAHSTSTFLLILPSYFSSSNTYHISLYIIPHLLLLLATDSSLLPTPSFFTFLYVQPLVHHDITRLFLPLTLHSSIFPSFNTKFPFSYHSSPCKSTPIFFISSITLTTSLSLLLVFFKSFLLYLLLVLLLLLLISYKFIGPQLISDYYCHSWSLLSSPVTY